MRSSVTWCIGITEGSYERHIPRWIIITTTTRATQETNNLYIQGAQQEMI
jgi:hypothetical protein